MDAQQLDLFGSVGIRAASEPAYAAACTHLCPVDLSDSALIEAIPYASLATCQGLTEEAARRKLRGAVPALEALCRRFKGFGLERPVSEQMAALRALAAIGDPEAIDTVRRLIAGQVIQGPGLCEAVRAAASLRCRLPEDTAAALLRHADPAVRADACCCAPLTSGIVVLLLGLLDELHQTVALAAACALGRAGRPEARAALHRALRDAPTAEVVEAVVRVADDESVVLLGRIPREQPAMRNAAVAALEDIDSPRSAAALARIGRGNESLGVGRSVRRAAT